MLEYDAIIIGAGQGGSPLAHKLADLKWKVAMIEKAIYIHPTLTEGFFTLMDNVKPV